MESLENRLGYRFRNRELLAEALNHSSYANEHRGGLGSNERLEFLVPKAVAQFFLQGFHVASLLSEKLEMTEKSPACGTPCAVPAGLFYALRHPASLSGS